MKVNNFPSWLILEITNRCNFLCQHCYLSAKHTGRDMAPELIAVIKKELSNKKVDVLAITGGEPLLHKDINKIVASFIPLINKIVIETNMSLVNDDFISFIKKYKDKIIIQTSTEGLGSHMAGRSISLIDIETKLKKLRNAGVKTAVLFTVSGLNGKELIRLRDYFRTKVDFFSVERLIPIGRGEAIRNLDKSSFSGVLKNCVKGNISCNDPLIVLFQEQSKNFVGCSAGIFACCIDASGNLFPCPKLRVRCGNISNNSISGIWQKSSVLRKLREREKNLNGKCSKCSKINLCGGCRAYAFALTNDWLGEDMLCPR